MGFTLTPKPGMSPPRVNIRATPNTAGHVFESVTVTRDGAPIREQPRPGGTFADVNDMEAPYGAPVTYRATGYTMDPASVLLNETWANLNAWTGDKTLFKVAAGRLESLWTTDGPTIEWASGTPFTAIKFTSPSDFSFYFYEFGPKSLEVFSLFGVIYIDVDGVYRATLGPVGGGDITVTFNGVGVTVSDRNNSQLVTSTLLPMGVRIGIGYSSHNPLSVGPILVTAPGTRTNYTATASVTLDPADAWLIHPSISFLAAPIDTGPHRISHDKTYVLEASGATRTSQTYRTMHEVIGRTRPVVVTTGRRAADEWTLILVAPTIELKNAIRDLVDDQSPLLLRSPIVFGWDLPDGWYSIGDLTTDRPSSPFVSQRHEITLPLTPVDPPVTRFVI